MRSLILKYSLAVQRELLRAFTLLHMEPTGCFNVKLSLTNKAKGEVR